MAGIATGPTTLGHTFLLRPHCLREERALGNVSLVEADMAHLEAEAMVASQALSTDDDALVAR